MTEDNVRPFRTRATELVASFKGSTISSHGFNEALATQASPELDVRLTKGDRTRRYHIRPGRNLSEWYCQVWFGETQHRGDRVNGVMSAQQLLAQYRREIKALITDGWTITDAP